MPSLQVSCWLAHAGEHRVVRSAASAAAPCSSGHLPAAVADLAGLRCTAVARCVAYARLMQPYLIRCQLHSNIASCHIVLRRCAAARRLLVIPPAFGRARSWLMRRGRRYRWVRPGRTALCALCRRKRAQARRALYEVILTARGQLLGCCGAQVDVTPSALCRNCI